MPCNTDHMEPTVKERQRKEAAELYVYAAESMGLRVHHDIPSGIIAASQHIYGDGYDPDKVVAMLCHLLRGMNEAEQNEIIYNGRKKMARRLAEWWEEHQAEDEKRLSMESWDTLVHAAKENPEDFDAVFAYVKWQDERGYDIDMIGGNISSLTGLYFDDEDSTHVFEFAGGVIILSALDGLTAYKGEAVT